jgi:hypothetical protein
MRPRTSFEWFRCIVEVLILPIFGLVSFILNTISSIENINSFKDRPKYIYTWYSELDGDIAYAFSGSNCSNTMTEDMITFVNNLKTGYIIFTYVICFILCVLSFLACNFIRIMRHASVGYPDLTGATAISTALTYYSLIFSVPGIYATKVEYGRCITFNGLLRLFMIESMMIFANIGMWVLMILVAYYFARRVRKVRRFEGEKFFRIVLAIMLVFSAAFLIFALVSKFGSVLEFQIGWDVSLSVDLAYGIIVLKYNNWKFGQIEIA